MIKIGFGQARLCSCSTNASLDLVSSLDKVLGTPPYYMSPEQLANTMVLLTTVFLGIAGLCQADIRWSGDTILVPGRVKNPKALAAAHRGASGSSSFPAPAELGSPAGGFATDRMLGRGLALFDRQTCPPTHPCKLRNDLTLLNPPFRAPQKADSMD